MRRAFSFVKPYMTLKNLVILVMAMAVMASTDRGIVSTAGLSMVLMSRGRMQYE